MPLPNKETFFLTGKIDFFIAYLKYYKCYYFHRFCTSTILINLKCTLFYNNNFIRTKPGLLSYRIKDQNV